MKKYVISLDAGTTSVRAMLFDPEKNRFVHKVQQEVGQTFPRSGWVEQDANEIYYKAAYVLNACASAAEGEIAGVGLANQRETVVLWNKETGEPVAPAIVWQCRRTAEFCASVEESVKRKIKEKTGLPMDAYFSASKIKWILERSEEARRLLRAGKLCAGTVDTFLLFRLSEGKIFATDTTNASRTMLFHIGTLDWDEELLSYFGVPREILPRVCASAANYGEIAFGGKKAAVTAVAGDQQAALFGQACLRAGDGKATYGTGLFLLYNTGETRVSSKAGLVTTVGYTIENRTVYALEGSAFNAGSCVKWLRDELGLISSSEESEGLALSVESTGGVYFVPAFTGLGAPHWVSEARGLLMGMTRATNRAHIVRAVLESIAYGARELKDCMARDSGIPLSELKVDGGACANNFLMQFQANLLRVPVNRPSERESTALGAALLARIGLNETDEKEVLSLRKAERVFCPQGEEQEYEKLYRGYQSAVKRAILPD